MCGVIGISLFEPNPKLLAIVVNSMLGMQNRGKDSSGLACYDTASHKIILWKKAMSVGQLSKYISDIEKIVNKKSFNVIVGHVRYATVGERNVVNAQPHKDAKNTLVVSANGDIPFCEAERQKLESLGIIFKSQCDGEVIANFLSHKINNENKSEEIACMELIEELSGAFSFTCIMPSGKLIAVRDKNGFRPLWWTINENGVYICSESSVLKRFNTNNIKEVMPGTMIVINPESKNVSIFSLQGCTTKPTPCILEDIYFASHTSISTIGSKLVDISAIRRKLGYEAGLKWLRNQKIIPEIISSVPLTGIPAAEGFVNCLLDSGRNRCRLVSFVRKDRFSPLIFQGRHTDRYHNLKDKLDIEASAVKGKIVAIVDDSIVRGDQSKYLATEILKAGAKLIIIISTAPLYKYPCFYGINTPDITTLLAHKSNTRGVESKIAKHVAKKLGVNWKNVRKRIIVQYLSCKDLYRVVGTKDICTSCFTGDYPIPVPESHIEI